MNNNSQSQTFSTAQISEASNSQSPAQLPNNLTADEYHELAVNSAIHPELIARNFIHLVGDTVLSYLFISNAIPRLNTGRVSSYFLKLYQYATIGGMWISGLDPFNNWKSMEWGRFKPLQQRIDNNGKLVKYESPPKTPNRVTYFDVPDCLWDLIARRYNIKRYHSPLLQHLQDRLNLLCFWAWVLLHPEIPIILCEGEKKAACLLSQGFVAIALPGIWSGRIGKKDFDERLHPDIMPFAQNGRKFIILFDYEAKPKTRWSIFQATVRTGQTIEAVGCTCEVALLPGPEKGVDDFVVSRSKLIDTEEAVNQTSSILSSEVNALLTAIISDAISIKEYQRLFHSQYRGLTSKYKPDIRVNVQYLSSAVTLPDSGLVAIRSDMGTGKTEIMRLMRIANPDDKFLNIGHRINLLKNLATRLDTEMYSDLSSASLAKASALSITIDSLHKLYTQLLKYGCIFIDEACQFLTHLLHSKTCREYRAQILEILEVIVYNARLVIIADAHLDAITIDFFRAMRPAGEKPFIIVNDWRNGDRLIYWYEGNNSSAIVAQISAALMNKQNIMVASDSKRFIKKLEQSLTVKVQVSEAEVKETDEHNQKPNPANGKLKLWSIHSDNSGSPENVAFIKDITNAVKNVNALLTSPSLGTGVDINEYHFDLVFGIFHAKSQTATECAQQLYRYRLNVPIHVWVAPRPPFGYQETNAQKIKERMLQTNEVTAFLLRIDRETGRRGVEKDWALDAYCQILAARNRSINNLRADLSDLLTEMGNKIISMGGDNDIFAHEQMKKAAADLDTAYFGAVTKAKDISATEYRRRQSKDYLKPEEMFECEKFRIQDAYGMEVTESLVEKDAGGQLMRAISALEAILKEPEGTIFDPNNHKLYPMPPTIVTDKDRQQREHLHLCWDWSNYSAKWLARFNLGLHDILKRLVAGGEITAQDPDLLRMVAIAQECSVHIKAILGFNVPDKCSPIWLLGTLLNQLGLKLVDHKVGPRGQQVKHFSLSPEELDFALKVIAHWEMKRNQKQERARQQQEDSRRYQAGMQAMYGIAPPTDSVSTPPPNCIGKPLGQGVNTTVENVDFRQFQPDDGEDAFKVNCVEVLRASLNKGVEAIKSVLRSWSEYKRWEAVLLLEEIAAHELRYLEQLVPQFYDWLSESVLPINPPDFSVG